MWVIRGDVV